MPNPEPTPLVFREGAGIFYFKMRLKNSGEALYFSALNHTLADKLGQMLKDSSIAILDPSEDEKEMLEYMDGIGGYQLSIKVLFDNIEVYEISYAGE